MNKKGFTLVELLTVIVIVGLIAIIAVPNFLNIVDTSKEKSYDILIKNIITASKMYYDDCEYGDLSDSKYGEYKCEIKIIPESEGIPSKQYIETNLGVLANTGLLKVDSKNKDELGNKKVLDPRNNKDISNCNIKIQKNIELISDSNGISSKVISYVITKNDTNSVCPDEYK